MAPQLLFFLARHIVCNGHPFHQFVALGNNYRRPPEVRPGRVCSLVMREKGGGERPAEGRYLCSAQQQHKNERVLAIAELNAN